jgi:hypothetical protein
MKIAMLLALTLGIMSSFSIASPVVKDHEKAPLMVAASNQCMANQPSNSNKKAVKKAPKVPTKNQSTAS